MVGDAERQSFFPSIATIVAGFAFAVALTLPASAFAWDWTQLPSGYSVPDDSVTNPDGSTCHELTVNGTYIGNNCSPDSFSAALDAYINSTICTVNPAAGQARGMCLPETTTAAPPPTETTPATTTTAVDPGTPPPPTQTVTVTVTTTDPTIEQRLQTLEQEYAALAARVDAIAQANTASWDAFKTAIDRGASVSDAALAGRSAGLNAIYELRP